MFNSNIQFCFWFFFQISESLCLCMIFNCILTCFHLNIYLPNFNSMFDFVAYFFLYIFIWISLHCLFTCDIFIVCVQCTALWVLRIHRALFKNRANHNNNNSTPFLSFTTEWNNIFHRIVVTCSHCAHPNKELKSLIQNHLPFLCHENYLEMILT